MLRARRMIVGAALAPALLVAAPPALACQVGKHARAHRDGPRKVRPPLIIGDSTMLLATPYLGARGIDADARGCRQVDQGIELLAARRRAGALPRVVVLALGANGSISPRSLRRALRIAGRRRVLGLVTPRRVGSGSARALFAARRRYPDRVVLIPWGSFSAAHGGWFAGDGLHVNATGARAFARLVRRRLDPFIEPRSLKVPATQEGAKPCGVVGPRGDRRAVFVVRGHARVTCSRARQLARSRPLQPIARWRYYDWRRIGRRPWSHVYVRTDRRVLVTALPAAAAAP